MADLKTDADRMENEFKALRKKTLGEVLQLKFKGENNYWNTITEMELQGARSCATC
jgi:hypothetical protein